MRSNIVVEMMSSEFVLWRCLHGGPVTQENLDQPDPNPQVRWDEIRSRNRPLLAKLTETYGSCAVIVRDGDQVVGQLRFYPKAICELAEAGPGFCMQQTFPCGPAEDFVEKDFPPLDQIADKSLFVHCMMTGAFEQENNPYRRKGLGSRMVRTLIEWARPRGWSAIEAHAYADLPCMYAVTGQASAAFWEKLGFRVVESIIEPALAESDAAEFVAVLLKEAAERGLDAEAARTRYTMRLDLT
jgi:hypothetical protein